MPRIPRRGGPPGQPHMQFVTHLELDNAILAVQQLAQQAIDQSGSKDNRMDQLRAIVMQMKDVQDANLGRLGVLEAAVSDLQARVTALESLTADQQQELDALALLFS